MFGKEKQPMPKLKNRMPKMCRDRNQAISWYKGKRIYLGIWGSPEADKSYKRFIAALLENPIPRFGKDETDVLISELIAGFLNHIETQTDRTDFLHFKAAVGYLVEIYGELSVNEFSPKKLKTCRNQMVKAGTLCRRMVNSYTTRIVRIFTWGIEEEYVNPSVVAALREVKNLQRGEKGTFDIWARDGTSNTILLSENEDAGNWIATSLFDAFPDAIEPCVRILRFFYALFFVGVFFTHNLKRKTAQVARKCIGGNKDCEILCRLFIVLALCYR